ncbi:MAG: DUF6531 domain-containing protein, partial [Actinomycetes bacterium]
MLRRVIAVVLCSVLAAPIVPDVVEPARAAPPAPAPPPPRGSNIGNSQDVAMSQEMQRGAGPAPVGDAPSPAAPSFDGLPGAGVSPRPFTPESAPPQPIPVPKFPDLGRRGPQGFDAATSVEDVNGRSEFATTYNNADGSQTLIASPDRMHFETGSGWERIDNTLTVLEDGTVTNGSNDWSVLFTRFDEGIAISTKEGVFGWRPEEAAAVAPVVEPDGTSVRYAEAWPGVDVIYRVRGGSVEEFIEIKERTARVSFRFQVDGAGLSMDAKGNIVATGTMARQGVRLLPLQTVDAKSKVVDTEGRVNLRVGNPVKGAAIGVPAVVRERARVAMETGRAGRPAKSDAVEAVSQTLEIGLDRRWLQSLEADRFPVTIDPSVITTPYENPWLYSYNTAGAVVPGYFRIGNPVLSPTSAVFWRTVVKFPYASAIAPGSRVQSVNFVTAPQAGNGQHLMEFRHATEWGYHAGGLPMPVLHNGLFDSANPSQWWSGGAPLIQRYQSWIDQGESGGALLLNGSEGLGVYSYKQFNMVMQLTWSRQPSVTQVAPAHLALIGADQPLYPQVTLSAAGTDPEGDPLQYRFYVAGPTGLFFDSGWQGSSTVTASMPNNNATSYAWSVEVYDGVSVASSAVRNFAIVHGAQTPTPQSVFVPGATPTINGFVSWSPWGAPLQWRFQLCELNPGLLCGPWSGWQAQAGHTGSHSLGTVNFSALGWSLQRDRRYRIHVETSESPTAIALFQQPFEVAWASGVPVTSSSQVFSGFQGSVGQINSLRPTLTAGASPGTVTYNSWFFCVYDLAAPPTSMPGAGPTSCPVHGSGWLSTGSYTVPSGVLTWGKEYGVYIWARNGASSSEVPGPPSRYSTRVAIINRLGSQSLDPTTGVDAATGNFVVDRTDIDVASPSGLLGIHRTYNSVSTEVGAFGRGWSSLLDQRVQWDPAGPGIWLWLADGSREYHGLNADGSYSRPYGSDIAVTGSPVPSGVWLRATDANETLFDFNTEGRLIRITDRDGHSLSFGPRNPTTFQQAMTDDESGRALTIVWSGNTTSDRVMSVSTQPVGGQVLTWTYGYVADRLTRACDPRNNPLTNDKCENYGYQSGLMTELRKVGRTAPTYTLTYNAGRVATRTDAAGGVYEYSAPTQVQRTPRGGTAQQVTEVVITDPRDFVVRERFDIANRLVNRVDQALGQQWWEYNSNGLLAKKTDETGATEHYAYDADANLTVRTDAMGRNWTSTYDAEHRKLTSTTPLGHTTTYEYGPNDQWSQEIAPWTADQPGVLQRRTRTELTIGNEPAYGGVGEMPAGLLRRTIDPAGRITVYDYDAKGDLRRVTDPAGKTTVYDYDELGREVTRTVTWLDGDNNSQTAVWNTTWTVLSQKATETEPAVTNQAASPAITHRRRTEWTYDDRGNVTRLRDVDRLGGNAAPETNYEFDLLVRESKVPAPDGGDTERPF